MKDIKTDTRHSLLSRLRHRSHGQTAWEGAWREFVERYLRLIYWWCLELGLAQTDAEDISQKVLEKLFTQIKTYKRDKGTFRQWLFAIVRNALRDWQRQEMTEKNRLKGYAQLVKTQASWDLAEQLEKDRLQEILFIAKQQVQLQCGGAVWEAFRMTEEEGHNAERAATALGITTASVYKFCMRVKKRLNQVAKRIQQEDED